MDSNRKQEFVFNQPKSIEEKSKLAKVLPDRLGYRIPIAVDPMDARADKAYAGWPERIYVIDVGGRVVYKGEPGPFGFKPDEAERSLAGLLGGK